MTEYEFFKSMLQSAIKEMISDGTISFNLERKIDRVNGTTLELSVKVDNQTTTYYPVRLD